MRYAALLLVAILASEPVLAMSETDSLTQECRRIAKRSGTLGDRAKMSTLSSAVKAAERDDNEERLDRALTQLQRFCSEVSQRKPLR